MLTKQNVNDDASSDLPTAACWLLMTDQYRQKALYVTSYQAQTAS